MDGIVEPGFESVGKAFEANFGEGGEVGAAFCLYLAGRPVVDVWGGVADPASGRRWERDTICRMDSSTKGVASAALLMLVEAGEVDVDAPVASYWPEFAANGKSAITVRQVLSHQSGVAAVDRWMDLDAMVAWTPCIEAVEAQAPYWEPGAAHGYHAYTFGWIVGEIVRRVSGSTIGSFVRDRIASPLGLDLWIGLPASELARIAPIEVVTMEELAAAATETSGLEGFDELTAWLAESDEHPAEATNGPLPLQQAVAQTEVGIEELNQPAALAAEIPSAGGVATARSHARLYAAMIGEVDGIRLIGPELVTEVSKVHAVGPDQVVFVDTAWGMGFQVPGGQMLFPAYAEGIFGHSGANGTTAFADPARGLALAYTRNNMVWTFEDVRSRGIISAVYECLA